MTLSASLRQGTAEAHRAAERSLFVQRFVSGRLDRDTYTRHLLALYDVYRPLETALTHNRRDPRIGLFCLPQLWRRAALERDLAFLLGPSWRRQEPVPTARRYAHRLADLQATAPLRLVSHAYVRYLGDLSGGQVLKRMAARHLHLDHDGVHFYEFPEIIDPSAFKDDFRRRLDRLEPTDSEREEILEEARLAFDLNTDIFEELVRGSDGPS